MIFYLLFQIFISWLIASCILRLFYKTLSVNSSEVYREPKLLTFLLEAIQRDFTPKAKFMAGMILHHSMGLLFAAIYYLIWYCEFTEISWTVSFIIGLISGVLRIISWIFLLEVIPSAHLANFNGYYLQLVFIGNVFTIGTFTVYKLLY